jgi:hypothetical protein
MLSSHMWVRKFMFCCSVFLVFLLSVCSSDLLIKLETQDQSLITQYSSNIFLYSPTKKHCLYFSLQSPRGVLSLQLKLHPLQSPMCVPDSYFLLVHSHFSRPSFHINSLLSPPSLWWKHITLSHYGLLPSHPQLCTWLSPSSATIFAPPPPPLWAQLLLLLVLWHMFWRIWSGGPIWHVNGMIIRVKNVIQFIRNGN